MKRLRIALVVDIDEEQPAFREAQAAGIDVLDCIQHELRLSVLEPSFEGEDLHTGATIVDFRFEVEDGR